MSQQERSARSRQAILEAAASVFDERGYDAASTTEILARTGFTRGALYHHFPSKEAIALALVAAQTEALAVPTQTVKLQEVIDLTQEFARRLQSDTVLRASVRLSVEQTSLPQPSRTPYEWSVEAISVLLQQAGEQGETQPGLNIDEIAHYIVGAFTGLQIVSQVYTGRQDLPERVSLMWRLLLPSIAVPSLALRLRTTPPAAPSGDIAE
ncbi:ScbR family autoregulator-binding transcription factor [Streptomyces sp. NPDC001678]|uniref:ScbR family autoregulator-binding transcription factor n=1 Tax=Streptomyces sp. NPDC001678 TaxID=3364599 RepID=UPI0036C169EA